MIRESYIQELEDTLLEVIEKKDQKTSRRFILALIEDQERDSTNIMHSIELLTTQMSSLQKEMNIRFESMDKRFESFQKEMNNRFESLQKEMNIRFEAMDKRFESMDKRIDSIDKRFETMDKRFEALTKRIDRFMIWSFGLTVTMAGVIIAVLKIWR